MDTEALARLQFAVTIMFHYIYPPLSIGLGVIMVALEGLWLKTKDHRYRRMAKFWTRIFALTFAIGVATGIVMEFEFGTNWANYSRYVGDVFGSALAAEGVFAFFLESGFLAILLFGWDRVGPKFHFFATLMVALGAHFSAVWIVVANSWMQTPAGFHIVSDGLASRAEITDFWAMVFNPSSMVRLAHTLFGCWLAGAFLVISVSAYYFLKKRHLRFSDRCMKVGLALACVALVAQAITGHFNGKVVAEHQPLKLAALEALYDTQEGAPIYLMGIPNTAEKRVDYGVAIPKVLSFLAWDDFNAEVTGLDAFPEEDWPKVGWVFQSYHFMLYMWGVMVLLAGLALWFGWKKSLWKKPWLLRLLVLSVLLPQIGNQAGWMASEMGRYPWIVYGLLRISEGLSQSVTSPEIIGSLIMFTALYVLLFALFVFLLDHKIKAGPVKFDRDTPYHHMDEYMEELDR